MEPWELGSGSMTPAVNAGAQSARRYDGVNFTPAEQAQLDLYKQASGIRIKEMASREAISRDDFANRLAIARISAGQSGKNVEMQTAAQLKIERMRIDATRDRMEQLEIPQLEVDAWYKAAQYDLGKAAQDIDRGQLGLQWTNLVAQAGQKPEDYFYAADVARGASERQDVPIFMNALLQNQAPRTGAPGGPPQPASATSLADSLLNYSGSNRERQDQRALEVAGQIFQRGGGALKPGVLEGLSGTEMKLLGSAGAKKGVDMPAWFEDWASKRINQGGTPVMAA